MNSLGQILANILLYGFLFWLLYDSAIADWDPWLAVVVAFVIVQAVAISLIPSLRAPRVSPGEYPFTD